MADEIIGLWGPTEQRLCMSPRSVTGTQVVTHRVSSIVTEWLWSIQKSKLFPELLACSKSRQWTWERNKNSVCWCQATTTISMCHQILSHSPQIPLPQIWGDSTLARVGSSFFSNLYPSGQLAIPPGQSNQIQYRIVLGLTPEIKNVKNGFFKIKFFLFVFWFTPQTYLKKIRKIWKSRQLWKSYSKSLQSIFVNF